MRLREDARLQAERELLEEEELFHGHVKVHSAWLQEMGRRALELTKARRESLEWFAAWTTGDGTGVFPKPKPQVLAVEQVRPALPSPLATYF